MVSYGQCLLLSWVLSMLVSSSLLIIVPSHVGAWQRVFECQWWLGYPSRSLVPEGVMMCGRVTKGLMIAAKAVKDSKLRCTMLYPPPPGMMSWMKASVVPIVECGDWGATVLGVEDQLPLFSYGIMRI